MSVPLCFDSIIGFTRKEDICVDDYLAEYSVSNSGLYLDELQGMNLRILNSTGGSYGIWEKMTNAIENAISSFKIDVLREILKTKEAARQRFYGDIGGKSFTTALDSYSLRGLRMYSDIVGGTYTLYGVSLILDQTGVADFSIYDDFGTVWYNGNLNHTAGKITYNAITPLALPLTGNYYFIYDANGDPYNNKLTCNCGGFKWCFNINHPCFKHSRDRWTEWAMVAGIYSNSDPVMSNWPTTRDAQGMILNGDFGCDTLGILCSEHSDWVGNEIDLSIAYAILYKAGSFLSAYIMDSEEVNRYTLLGIDGLTANMVYYEERYKVMLEFIAANIELDRNECLKCRETHGYKRMSQML